MTSKALRRIAATIRPGNVLQTRISGTPSEMADAAEKLLALIQNGSLALDCATDNLENIKRGRHARSYVFRLTVAPGWNTEDLVSLAPGLDYVKIL